MTLDDLEADRQPEACTAAGRRPRGEERGEDPAPGLGVHADPAVGHDDADTVVLHARRDAKLAATGHGFNGVVEQVHKNLLEGVRVHLQARQIAVLLRDSDSGLLDPEAEQLQGGPDQGVEIARDSLRRPRRGELQERSDDGPGADRLGVDHRRLLVAGIVGWQLGQQQLGEAQDAGERVVHLVSDRGRQLAHGPELAGAHQLRLDPLDLEKLALNPGQKRLVLHRHADLAWPPAAQGSRRSARESARRPCREGSASPAHGRCGRSDGRSGRLRSQSRSLGGRSARPRSRQDARRRCTR